ncbi:MAG: HemK2/MTQ2 family protein methyltransferase, partial [Conexivisphaera sp.]
GSPLEAVVCDAARPFREDAFDLIYFNPPYLPCDRDEDPAVCGGRGGVEVALEFLRSAAGALRRGGRMVALVRAEGAGEVLGEARTMGLEGRIACRLRMFFEELVALELLRP